MIILLVVLLAAFFLLGAMANIVISEVLTATNEANQVRAQNLAEMGLAFGWAAVEDWSTWCVSGAQAAGEPSCPLIVVLNNVGGVQPQGGTASAQIDRNSAPDANLAIRVVVGYGNTTFANTANPAQLATGDAFIRQTALVLPAAFSFGIFSNTSAMVSGVPSMPPSPNLNNNSGMPSNCLTNAAAAGAAGGNDVTDICQTMGPLYSPNPTNGTINVGYPLIGTVYANSNTVGNGVEPANGGAYASPTSPVTSPTSCNASTLCLMPANGGTAGASLTGPQPAVANTAAVGQSGTLYSGAPQPTCNTGACGTANVGTVYQFPAWNFAGMLGNAITQNTRYISAQAFYQQACNAWYNGATKVTTIPVGMYFIEDQVVVFDNDPTRCLGNVVLQGGSITVYCTGAGGTAPCGSDNAANYPPANNLLGTGLSQLWSGSPEIPAFGAVAMAPNSCSNTTPCGDIILGGPATTTSPGCTPPTNPCSFTFTPNGYPVADAEDDNTPVLLAGGSIGSCATGCVNTVTYNSTVDPVYVYGNGYTTGVGAAQCGLVTTADCDVAYILPPYAAQATPPCGVATGGTAGNPADTPGVFIKGMVYVLANRDRSRGNPGLGVDAYSTYGWCVGADANNTVALQGSLLGEAVYEFEGQLLYDPSMHFTGFNGEWRFCTPTYSACNPLSNANPMTGGSVTVIPLSESTGQ